MAGSFLESIVAERRRDAAAGRERGDLDAAQRAAESAPEPLDFRGALARPGIALIAEVKKASPSAGTIAAAADPAALARSFHAGGAAAISVLTEPAHFQGSLEDLRAVREAVSIPVLRKDFVCDPLHVWEARACGADAVLLIVAALSQAELAELVALCENLGMAADVEVHGEDEVDRALEAGARIVAVNARDLSTLRVDPGTIERIRPLIPEKIVVVAESGISTRGDVERLERLGVDAVHVGEALMRSADPASAVRALLGSVATGS